MKNDKLKWIYLIGLSLVWGSSFILIKFALIGLSPMQVGAIRILLTSFFLLIVGYKTLFNITKRQWLFISINAFLGTFFPAFLFAFAINKMDSSVAAILNSFTPLNTLILGALLFGYSFQKKQILGIIIGLIGTVMLISYSNTVDYNQRYFYMSLILISTIGYAINVNIIKRYLSEVKALGITTGNFVILIIPTLLVLFFENQQNALVLSDPITQKSILYLVILALFGTAIAKTMFNKLVQISTPIFSASVTYLIPIVAVFWGFAFGENLNYMQLVSGIIILLGVYLVNKLK